MANLTAALKHRMDHLITRQGVVSSNIANANTPGYLSRDLKFSKLVDTNRMNIAVPNKNHLQPSATAQFGKLEYSTENMTLSGNSVKIDDEMVKLSETQLNYTTTTQLFNKYKQMQRLVLGQR